jgi:protein tyrosine phosphatase (PTP) superfamily phosphohydrolase (DUF442 family)
MTTTRRLLLVPALALIAAAGCKTTKHNRCDTCPPPPPPGAPIMAPAPMAAPPGGTLLPPAPPPPGVPGTAAGPAAPPPSFPSGSGFPPVASFYPPPSVRLSPPDSVVQAQAAAPAPAAKSPTIRLLPPEFGSGSSAAPPANRDASPSATTPSLPVGIVDFAPALPDRVAAGRKPALEGLDWLKTNGYKAVVQLRRPGESDAADRKQVEARGLAFTSFELSPATLSWATVDAFAKLVGDPATQPLFVYDADGSLSGGLWYLYYRRVERLSDEAARLRAARLGLRETADGSQREMWLAVQKLLAAGV